MSGPRKNQDEKDRGARQAEVTPRGEVSVPAIRHVGPTLESDPKYLDLVGSGGPTPEAQIAEGTTSAPDVREIVEQNLDPLSGRAAAPAKTEPLKTRLPGDTSSDPHTDVGPDNATVLQGRGETKKRVA